MIRLFLCLFRAYRDLEAELEQAASARIQAEDDVRLWRAKCEYAEEARKVAFDELREALKRFANFEARRNGSLHVPFPDVEVEVALAVEPDMAGVNAPPAPPRRSLRDIQQEAVAQSRRTAHDRRMALANGTEDS